MTLAQMQPLIYNWKSHRGLFCFWCWPYVWFVTYVPIGAMTDELHYSKVDKLRALVNLRLDFIGTNHNSQHRMDIIKIRL